MKEKSKEDSQPFGVDDVKKIAEAAAEDVAKFIKKYPYQTVGAALALGLIIGLFIIKKRQD